MIIIGPLFIFGRDKKLIGCRSYRDEHQQNIVEVIIKGPHQGLLARIELEPNIAKLLASDLMSASES